MKFMATNKVNSEEKQSLFKGGVPTVAQICEWLEISWAIYFKYLRYMGLDGKLRSYSNSVN